jgi:hypothetical protein
MIHTTSFRCRQETLLNWASENLALLAIAVILVFEAPSGGTTART